MSAIDGCELDDLQIEGLKLYQHPQRYRFTTDAVLLAHFARVSKTTRALDIGSGSGVVGLLLVGKYGAARCDCVEIQSDMADMSRQSVAYNRLDDRMDVYHTAVQEFRPQNPYDLVVCNPPYTKHSDGVTCADAARAVSRHEISLTLEDLIAAAKRLTKFGGSFCLIHQAERLSEIFCLLSRHGFQPKRLRTIKTRAGRDPTLVLIDARRGGKTGLKILPELTVTDAQGIETEETKRIYGRVEGRQP